MHELELDPPVLCVKFDGSQMPDYKKATASCVLYLKGQSPFLLRREHLVVTSSGEAEQMGFILAIDTVLQQVPRLKSEWGISKCRFYGDSQVLFKHVRGTSVTRSGRTAFLSTIARYGLRKLEIQDIKFEMYWIPRKCNILADMLCRTAYNVNSAPFKLPKYLQENQ